MVRFSMLKYETFVKFRTPASETNGSLADGETSIDGRPVSYFYTDVYGGELHSLQVALPEQMRVYPCLMMEPAYSLVQDRMTIYGTCDYEKMFRLELNRTGGRWNATAQLSAENCRKELVEDFVLEWHGRNYTVSAKSLDVGDFLLTVHLLLRKRGMSHALVREIYPVLDILFGKVRDENCQCLSGAEFAYRETWDQLCKRL
uniref:(northern house mosquito) hypothetical protein n=1 Tax=Culex pipiens TaxID=7175 RepID=A0A8D8MKZ9_CULPI